MTDLIAKPHIVLRANGTADVIHRVDRSRIKAASELMPVSSYDLRGWYRILESFPGAWQQNVEVRSTRDLLSFPPVYACITLIAGDIAKLRLTFKQLQESGIWLETPSPKSVVLRKPNDYQTQGQWVMAWLISRLLYGNTYVLKERDARGVVNALHVLDPCRVCPLVSEDGQVFYRLGQDYLADISENDIAVPASEIGHDRVAPLWHPLVGVSPLYAAGVAGTQGLAILNNSSTFFSNMSRPSGLLTTPKSISSAQALALKTAWESGYGGTNQGKTAVLGDDMKFVPIAFPADQSQTKEQADQAALWVAMAFKVPPYKLGLQNNLTFNNVAQLNQDYYSQCLQTHMEDFERTLDDALELATDMRTEFDVSGLFRMDPQTRALILKDQISSGLRTINEGRAEDDMTPIDGGANAFLQQQMFPVSRLDRAPDQNTKPPAPEPPPKALDPALLRLKFGDVLRKVA